MILPFKYYMHDNASSDERVETILDANPAFAEAHPNRTVEEWSELIGRPFYEITVNCTLDTETGAVRFESVS